MTPDMENKLAFLALKVKFGQQRRYQEWFFRQVSLFIVFGEEQKYELSNMY